MRDDDTLRRLLRLARHAAAEMDAGRLKEGDFGPVAARLEVYRGAKGRWIVWANVGQCGASNDLGVDETADDRLLTDLRTALAAYERLERTDEAGG